MGLSESYRLVSRWGNGPDADKYKAMAVTRLFSLEIILFSLLAVRLMQINGWCKTMLWLRLCW